MLTLSNCLLFSHSSSFQPLYPSLASITPLNSPSSPLLRHINSLKILSSPLLLVWVRGEGNTHPHQIFLPLRSIFPSFFFSCFSLFLKLKTSLKLTHPSRPSLSLPLALLSCMYTVQGVISVVADQVCPEKKPCPKLITEKWKRLKIISGRKSQPEIFKCSKIDKVISYHLGEM